MESPKNVSIDVFVVSLFCVIQIAEGSICKHTYVTMAHLLWGGNSEVYFSLRSVPVECSFVENLILLWPKYDYNHYYWNERGCTL